MVHPQKHIDHLADEAIDLDLVAQLSPDHATRIRNQQRASDLRTRIGILKQRIARLKRDHPEK
jgi:hypothetical protein